MSPPFLDTVYSHKVDVTSDPFTINRENVCTLNPTPLGGLDPSYKFSKTRLYFTGDLIYNFWVLRLLFTSESLKEFHFGLKFELRCTEVPDFDSTNRRHRRHKS